MLRQAGTLPLQAAGVDPSRPGGLDQADLRGIADRVVAWSIGLGLLVANTGLWIATIDNATGEILSVDFEAGHQDGTTWPALCAALV